ncbi:MAG: membrane protein insertion efficiency factor YidD [Deltaproteobacteria bacterium]|nr:membrane protein insertion efficiency factor YidD [Deltaproteobacteria bacterium]
MNNQPPRKVPVAVSIDYRVQWFSSVALAMIAGYRAVLSPVLLSTWGPACRFEPTCSVYAAQAITRYGITRGGRMALKRLVRCRPLSGWGFDPIPEIDRANRIGIGRHRGLSR